jgi:hypothetical protein
MKFAVRVARFLRTFNLVALHHRAQQGLIFHEQLMAVCTLVWSIGDTNKVVKVQLPLERSKSRKRKNYGKMQSKCRTPSSAQISYLAAGKYLGMILLANSAGL